MKTCCWKMKEDDRISTLPDCLLLEILSRLPSTKHAIRTATLSKRWEHLWTWLPTLIFIQSNNRRRRDFVSFINKTLTQCRQLKLEQFRVIFTSDDYDSHFDSQVNNWIRYATRCNVEKLDVVLHSDYSPFICVQYQPFFIGSCFIHLRVEGCKLNPVGPISWKNLKSLSISFGGLDQDVIENILSGSPLLETLELKCCYGYRRLDITSKILKNLLFCGYDIIEINAPNILSLTIEDYDRFYKPLFVVSSLVQANLDNNEFEEEAEEEENLKDFILNFPNVKELNIIGVQAAQVVSRLEAKGFVFPANVKFPDVTSDCSDSDSDW